MTRLQSSVLTLKKEWQSLEEIVGVVLNRLGERLNDHPVTINLPSNLPAVFRFTLPSAGVPPLEEERETA